MNRLVLVPRQRLATHTFPVKTLLEATAEALNDAGPERRNRGLARSQRRESTPHGSRAKTSNGRKRILSICINNGRPRVTSPAWRPQAGRTEASSVLQLPPPRAAADGQRLAQSPPASTEGRHAELLVRHVLIHFHWDPGPGCGRHRAGGGGRYVGDLWHMARRGLTRC